MKKTLLLMTIILCASATVLSQNLLTNGSFEDFTENEDGTLAELAAIGTFNAWASNNAGKNAVRLSDQSPQHGAQFIYWREGQRGPIRQVVALTDGKEYRASVWVKWSEGAVNSGATTLRIDDAGGIQVALVNLDGMETDWTEYVLEFTATGTNHEIFINRLEAGVVKTIGEMHVDNAVLTEVDPSSTKSILGEHFSFYPNPFNDILHINNAVGIKTASITNLAGQVIIKQEINSSNDQSIINTSSLEKGVYLLQVTGNQGETQTVKLIKH